MSRKWLWLAIGVVVLLAGCGGGGGGTPNQDFIVGTWELYALSDSYSGEKVPAEEAGIFYTLNVYSGGTWTDSWTVPGSPPGNSAGTWEKTGDDYIFHEPGADDWVLHREGGDVYQVEWIDGFGLLWAWLHKV